MIRSTVLYALALLAAGAAGGLLAFWVAICAPAARAIPSDPVALVQFHG